MAAKRPARGSASRSSAATRKSSAKAPARGATKARGAKPAPKTRAKAPAKGKSSAVRRPAASSKRVSAKPVKAKSGARARAAAKPRTAAGRGAPGKAKANVKPTRKSAAKTPAKGKGAKSTAKVSAAKRSAKPSAPAKKPVRTAKTATARKTPAKATTRTAGRTTPAKAAPRGAAKAPAAKSSARTAPGRATAPVPRKAGPKGKGSGGLTFTRLPHIDDDTLDKIIDKLQEMRTESRQTVNMQMSPEGKYLSEEQLVGDDMDLASQDRDREFNMLMHERHLRRLQQVEEAFERINDGTYGLCEGTEEPINPKRLMIMPLARFSLEYQQAQEKMLGRTPEDYYFEEDSSIESEDE